MGNDQFVNEYLSSDHRRLDILFASLIDGVTQDRPLANQQSLFHLLKTGILRHMHWEEKTLFPYFDMAPDTIRMEINTLKAEHAELESMLTSIESKMDQGFDLEYLKTLGQIVESHHEKEEAIIYPAINAMGETDIQEKIAIDISKSFQ